MPRPYVKAVKDEHVNVVRLPAAPAVQVHRNAALERVREFIRLAQDAATRADQHGRHEEAARHWQDAEALALVLALAERGA
jgi:hypothetical protein